MEVSVLEIILGAVVIVLSLFLTVAVLMQSGKDKNLSGAIAGGADTFFSKAKANTWDRILSKATLVVSIVLTVLIAVMYLVVGK